MAQKNSPLISHNSRHNYIILAHHRLHHLHQQDVRRRYRYRTTTMVVRLLLYNIVWAIVQWPI